MSPQSRAPHFLSISFYFAALLVSVFACSNLFAAAITAKEFANVYQKNLKVLRAKLPANLQDPCTPDPNAGVVKDPYVVSSEVPLAELCADQSSYSFFKISLELKKGRPSKKIIDYVMYRGRRYVVDGHHHMLLSLYRGDETIPARLIAQFDSRLSEQEFLEAMTKKNYLYDQMMDPASMVDNPFLNKVREIVRDTDIEKKKIILKGKSLKSDLIGVFTPSKPYYSELRLAEVLKESGYNIKNVQSKKMLEIFERAKKNKDSRVANLVLLDSPFEIFDKKSFEEAQELVREKVNAHFKICNKSLEN